jgi:quinol monooxygenase YgiN
MTGSPLPRPNGRVGACVVIAEFEVKPEAFGDFSALARRFAEECLESEPGCWQFEVVQLETTPHGVLFYEVYDDAAAFEAHCKSAHLARFKVTFPPLIIGERPLRRGLT